MTLVRSDRTLHPRIGSPWLRCVTTTVTNQAMFAALEKVDTTAIRGGLLKAETLIDYLLNLISGRLGHDHDRVLGSRYSFPLLVRYLHQRGGSLPNRAERDKLLYWYIHTLLRGQYAGSTETVINQDLAALSAPQGLDRLIDLLRRTGGISQSSRATSRALVWEPGFTHSCICSAVVHHARDWDTGIELSNHMLGKLNTLQVHHLPCFDDHRSPLYFTRTAALWL